MVGLRVRDKRQVGMVLCAPCDIMKARVLALCVESGASQGRNGWTFCIFGESNDTLK